MRVKKNQGGTRETLKRIWRTALALTVLAAVGTALAGCFGGGDDSSSAKKGEVTIVCAGCQSDPTIPNLQFSYEAAQRFNKKYAGRYRITILRNQAIRGDEARLTYYQRLAVADDLPDLMEVTPAETAKLAQTGKLMDFEPELKEDTKWLDAFYPKAFDALKGKDGQIFAIPQTRDAIGIWYNERLLREAGVPAFPQTWDDFTAACEKIKAKGHFCMAMDGMWTTTLMWANLIGTQPGGAEFLNSGIGKGDYGSNAAVVKATEMLKSWQAAGFFNSDSFSGEYENAANPFVRGQAVMIPNGPWMVKDDIKAKKAIKGLYDEVGYEVSPGFTADQRGVVVLAGQGSWASGSRDQDKQEAVTAFVKYFTSPQQMFGLTQAAGTYTPVNLHLTDSQRKALEPKAAHVVEESGSVPFTYPTAFLAAPAGLQSAWTNLWPAYAKGKMSTEDFLSRLYEESSSPTG